LDAAFPAAHPKRAGARFIRVTRIHHLMNDACHRTTGHRLPVHFWKPTVFAIAIECPAAFEKPAPQTKRMRPNLPNAAPLRWRPSNSRQPR